MAETEETANTNEDDEFQQGTEPGASRNSMLVTNDSLEDIAQYLDGEISESDLQNLRQTRHSVPDPGGGDVLTDNLDQDSTGSRPTNIHQTKNKNEENSSSDTTTTNDVKTVVPNTSPRNCDKTIEVSMSDPPDLTSDSVLVSARSTSPASVTHQSDPASYDNTVNISQVNRKLSALSSDEDIQVQNNKAHEENKEVTQEGSNAAVIVPEETCPELEYVNSAQWRNHEKHIFILSRAGKPIYSRHGDEDRLVTLMGVMQALTSFVQSSKDTLRYVVAGDHKFVFLLREHLILVAIARTGESNTHILLQLTYIYNQVLSILTLSQLNRIFSKLHNYDLRRLLSGTEKLFDNLLNLMNHDPSFFLGAVRCLPLEAPVREHVAQSIAQNAKIKDLVFGIVIANNQLVTLVRMKRYFLHPVDLHLIFNLVSASESFKTAESWTPICLPKFDTNGYLHAYVSYLDESYESCILLFTVDKDLFFTLADCKKKILEKLNKHQCLKSISDSIRRGNFSISLAGIPELRHFLYKSRSTAQFTSPRFEAPYCTDQDCQRIFRLYQYLHHRLHSPSRPLKILFHVGPHETLLGWVTSGFELYAVFGPLVTKPIAINSVNKLLKWIKKEEDRLFILNSPTF